MHRGQRKNMDEWKNTEWLERLKDKPLRCWIRDEIEEIIKEEQIDRSRFHEASKFTYEGILRKFYYSFFQYEENQEYAVSDFSYSYGWLKLHKRLQETDTIRWYTDWTEYIQSVTLLIPEAQKQDAFFLILGEGWVYEGYIHEIMAVLLETDNLLKDFYIVSKKFDWMIVHCDDGECMFKVY